MEYSNVAVLYRFGHYLVQSLLASGERHEADIAGCSLSSCYGSNNNCGSHQLNSDGVAQEKYFCRQNYRLVVEANVTRKTYELDLQNSLCVV